MYREHLKLLLTLELFEILHIFGNTMHNYRDTDL